MYQEEASGAGTVLLAFILGAVSGAALALLYAPASGRETRDYLGERAREGRDQVTSAANKARDFAEQGRQTVSSVIEKSRHTIDQGMETVSAAVEQGREAYQQAKARNTA